MKLSDIAGVLGKVAPTIAAAAGGPLAGSAVTAIEGVFGLKPEGDATKRQDAAAAAIAGASPEQLLNLKKADADFQSRMAELGFENAAELEKLAGEDRANARNREMNVKDFTPRVLAIAITFGFFALLGYMAGFQVPAESKDLLNVMVGTLGTAWVAIVTYYFGSSAGSDAKTQLLAAKSDKQ